MSGADDGLPTVVLCKHSKKRVRDPIQRFHTTGGMTMPQDRVTANLPSRDFDRTATFYGSLGFDVAFRNPQWMILRSGSLEIEFFPMENDPEESWFSACIRVDELDALYKRILNASLPERASSTPRLTAPTVTGGLRMLSLIDEDGSLLRCIENPK